MCSKVIWKWNQDCRNICNETFHIVFTQIPSWWYFTKFVISSFNSLPIKNYKGCEILSCLQANKLPWQSIVNTGRGQETFKSEAILLLIKTLTLDRQGALAPRSHWSLPSAMRMVVGIMRSQAQMDDVPTVSLYYNQVIANLEASILYGGLSAYLTTSGKH